MQGNELYVVGAEQLFQYSASKMLACNGEYKDKKKKNKNANHFCINSSTNLSPSNNQKKEKKSNFICTKVTHTKREIPL